MIAVVAASIALAFALAALCYFQRDEIRYLRSRVEAEKDHERRLDRTAAGLPEVGPVPSKPDLCPPGLQIRIDQAIAAWEGGTTQEMKLQDVRVWRQEGRTWDWIAQELEADMG